MSQLHLPDNSLAVFLDETGNEDLSDRLHPVFGMGGCAVMASSLDPVVREPWKRVRTVVAGGPDAPLHASRLSAPVPTEHIELIAAFFRDQPFFRLGTTCSVRSSLHPSLSPAQTVLASLKNRILDIVNRTPATSVYVIFETNERLKAVTELGFSDFDLTENGRSVPCQCFFMPKSSADPALEVADFIAHAIGRQARRRARGMQGFAPDFQAIFHSRDGSLSSFLDIVGVTSRDDSPSGLPSF